jgi:hypothetical protein
MTTPAQPDSPTRSPGAAWGAGHLALGAATLIALLYAAPQWPVSAGVAVAVNVVGLCWIALSAWRHLQQGWNLRQWNPCHEASFAEGLTDLALGAAMTIVLLRGGLSRLHIAGLDRLVAVVLTVAAMSLVLVVLECFLMKGTTLGSPKNVRLARARIIAAAGLIALVLVAEGLPL